jgi:hypothetical protein
MNRTTFLAIAASLFAVPVAAQACPSAPSTDRISIALEPAGLATFCHAGATVKMGFAYGTPQGPAYASYTGHSGNRYDDIVIVGKDHITYFHVSGLIAETKKQ